MRIEKKSMMEVMHREDCAAWISGAMLSKPMLYFNEQISMRSPASAVIQALELIRSHTSVPVEKLD